MPREALAALLAEAAQSLRALDVAFADFLAEQSDVDDLRLPLLGAIVSQQAAEGHLCLALASLDALAQQQSWPERWRANLLDRTALLATMAASPLVDIAPATSGAPLVLDEDRLYLRRYWDHERQVANAIGARLGAAFVAPAALADELRRLFPTAEHPAWTRVAGALATRHRFTVITGGPGTGKTTTVVRVLGLLQTLQARAGERPLRIRVAAPTGKAAARLQASIGAQVATLPVDETVRANIPTDVLTLHRLLGSRPQTRRFLHHHGNRLHLDVLVIDEASMVDLELMSAVLDAMPPTARLILLGDKDQLSSVEAGAVLGDICQRADAGHYDDATIDWLREASGDDLAPWRADDARALDQCIVMLRTSHRFDANSGIGQLASAMNRGDDATSMNLLRNQAELTWRGYRSDTLRHWVLDAEQGYRYYLDRLERERPSDGSGRESLDRWAMDVLHAYERFQLLSVLRRGEYGTEGLNENVARWLAHAGLIQRNGDWYEGRPVIMTRNDYPLGLMNGDIGIALRVPIADGKHALRVAFPVADGARGTRIRFVPPSRLGTLESAFALTVHKSQGSEFDHVALIFPDKDGPLLTRELLYTAVTRARQRFSLAAKEELVAAAIKRRTRRDSMLSERLRRDGD